MTSSLVGSEMCIRDRVLAEEVLATEAAWLRRVGIVEDLVVGLVRRGRPVSYTHLTLPTICSV
eukprot:7578015-Prorocentrum_lima.AAC.1